MPLGRIGDYVLLETLGQGGMSVVFKAHDPKLNRTVALKVLPVEYAADRERRARLMREARAGASLSHSSIAACYDAGEAPPDPPDLLSPGTPGPHPELVMYVSMEYIEGSDLKSLLTGRPLPIPRVLEIAAQIAAGLECAHAAGVIHRDLKPANIRVAPDGRIKIIDFGLARLTHQEPDLTTTTDLTSGGRVLGTAYYMSPEQAQGLVVDARSDLFSLGTILYEMVAGRVPFEGDSFSAVQYNVVNTEPQPLARYAANVPDELQRIAGKLLEKDPRQRYQSAQEARLDLERLARGASSPRPPSGWEARRKKSWGSKAIVGVAMLALVVMVIAVFLSAVPHPPTTLAVMPFVNRTGETGLDYLGEGLANDVHGDLVRRSALNVASFLTALSLKQPMSPTDAGHELGVVTVLDGLLRRDAGATTLVVELVDAIHGKVLWTEEYPYTLNEAVDIKDKIVSGVALKLTGHPPATVQAPATKSVTAYDLYLRAGVLLDEPDDPLSPDRALALYEQALAQDPDYALAWAGACKARVAVWKHDKSPEGLRRAEEAVDHALRLNPILIEARVARAQLYRVTGRYPQAIAELQAVREINPAWDDALIQLAAVYRDTGDLGRAESCLREAIKLRPDNWRPWNTLGAVMLRRGDFAGAREAFRQIVRILPGKNRGYEQLGAVEILAANFAQAITFYEKLPAPVESAPTASNIATAYFFARRMPEARRYYQLALDLEPTSATYRMNLGDWYVRAGHADSARKVFGEASSLIDTQLQVNPKDTGLWIDRALCRAKLGNCDGAAAALATVATAVADSDAAAAHEIARIEALCGHRDRALAAVERAMRNHVPPAAIRAEDEFARLAGDPRFEALLTGKR